MGTKRTHRTKVPKSKKPTTSSQGSSSSLSSIASKVDVHGGASLNADEILQLQRVYGNQATIGILQRQSIIQREDDDDNGGGGDAKPKKDDKQPAPDEAIEVEADDVDIKAQDKDIEALNAGAAEVDKLAKQAKDISISKKDKKPNAVPVGPDVDDDAPEPQGNGMIKSSNGVEDNTDPDQAMAKNVSSPTNKVDNDQDIDNESDYNPQGKNKITKSDKPEIAPTLGLTVRGYHLGGGTAVTEGFGTGVGIQSMTIAGMDAKNAVEAINAAKDLDKTMSAVDVKTDGGAVANMNWIQKISDLMTNPPVSLVLNIQTLLRELKITRDRHRYMKTYKKLMQTDSTVDSKAAKKSGTKLDNAASIGAYAFAKTKRGFWINLARAVVSAGQFIARMITFLSGASAAFISEAVNGALALSKSVVRVGQMVKGVYKAIRSKRGKRRLEAANTIVDKAINGDEQMLQLILDLKPFDVKTRFMHHIKHGLAVTGHTVASLKSDTLGTTDYNTKSKRRVKVKQLKRLLEVPKTKEDLKDYLAVAQEAGRIHNFKAMIASTMKSS